MQCSIAQYRTVQWSTRQEQEHNKKNVVAPHAAPLVLLSPLPSFVVLRGHPSGELPAAPPIQSEDPKPVPLPSVFPLPGPPLVAHQVKNFQPGPQPVDTRVLECASDVSGVLFEDAGMQNLFKVRRCITHRPRCQLEVNSPMNRDVLLYSSA